MPGWNVDREIVAVTHEVLVSVLLLLCCHVIPVQLVLIGHLWVQEAILWQKLEYTIFSPLGKTFIWSPSPEHRGRLQPAHPAWWCGVRTCHRRFHWDLKILYIEFPSFSSMFPKVYMRLQTVLKGWQVIFFHLEKHSEVVFVLYFVLLLLLWGRGYFELSRFWKFINYIRKHLATSLRP